MASLTESVQPILDRLAGAIGSVLLGKPEVVEGALVALLAGGHVLIEDVPGVGKTLLARAVAKSLDCGFRRIQFTPDLLPSDIIGSSVFNSQTSEFTFKPGPLFANVVLADEINRTSPRTQSALLEAMNDVQVSVDGHTYPLAHPFFVLATQNPFEFEGTYPLPESQLDRFMLRLRIGYPSREAESRLLTEHRAGEPIEHLASVAGTADLLRVQDSVRQVAVSASINTYLLDIIEASRNHPDLRIGASTRGAIMLYRAAQALALLRRRDYVVPDDIKQLALPVLAHRVIARVVTRGDGRRSADSIITEILDKTSVPD